MSGNDQPFVHRIRVRYAEIDGQGVVFNAHWLTYFDDSCTRFMTSLGFGPNFWTKEFDVMLVKAVVEWVGPAGFDEWIDVAVAPSRIGTKSFDLSYEASIEGRDACRATITYCAVRPGLNEPFAIPDAVRAALVARAVTGDAVPNAERFAGSSQAARSGKPGPGPMMGP